MSPIKIWSGVMVATVLLTATACGSQSSVQPQPANSTLCALPQDNDEDELHAQNYYRDAMFCTPGHGSNDVIESYWHSTSAGRVYDIHMLNGKADKIAVSGQRNLPTLSYCVVQGGMKLKETLAKWQAAADKELAATDGDFKPIKPGAVHSMQIDGFACMRV